MWLPRRSPEKPADGLSGLWGTIFDMWQALVVCSACAEETEVVLESLDDLDQEVCPCGYSYVLLSLEGFEAVYAESGKLIELPVRKQLDIAA